MAWRAQRARRARRQASWSQKRKWWDHKPSSVYPLVRADGHLSGMAVASHLVRPTRSSNDPGRVSLLIWPCSDRGLPCRARYRTRGGLLPHRFTLTLGYKGGLFSVALSVALRRPGVTWRSALWSSDFPRVTPEAGHPRPSAPPLPGEEITGPQGHGARLYFVKRRITRPKLSVAAPSSQNPACSLNAANRNRGHSLCANVARSGCKPRAESANTLRSR